MNWRSSGDEQTATGDCPKVLTKVTVKVNLNGFVLKKIASYIAIPLSKGVGDDDEDYS